MTLKQSAKKTWNFLWHSDSPWSWLSDLIIAFILVRFVVFPLLGMLLMTPLPLVVVESGSMEHHGTFEDWWGQFGLWYPEHNITKSVFKDFTFFDGFDKGDIIVTQGQEEYHIGDVVIFRTPVQSTPIIHRIVSYNKNFQTFATKGDNNPAQLGTEIAIKKEHVVSKAIFRVPKVGWIKLVFVELFRFFL